MDNLSRHDAGIQKEPLPSLRGNLFDRIVRPADLLPESYDDPLASLDFTDKASAEAFVEALQISIDEWNKRTAPNEQIAVIAVLTSGHQVRVRQMRPASHDTVLLEGELGDASPWLLLAHQATLQIVCSVEAVEPEKKKYPIGFPHKYEATRPPPTDNPVS